MEGTTLSEKRKSADQASGANKKPAVESTTTGRGKKGATAAAAAATSSKGGDFTTSQEFKEMLLSRSVESLAYVKKNGVVFFVDRTDKVSEVFKGLVRQNFLSAPVLMKTKHKWYGFVDINDIVEFYIENFGDQLGNEGKAVWDTIAEKEGFLEKTVDDVMKSPRRKANVFHPITVGYSLWYALETLAREHELHRLPIIDSDWNLKSVLSLTQVIEFLYDNLGNLGTIKDKPVGQITGVMKPVWSINHNDPAIAGFKLMQEKNVGGIAVVDDSGALVGLLSQRDLKAIRLEDALFRRLFQQARNFLQHLREEFKDDHPKRKKVLHEGDTLEHAITLLVENKIHRAFVVDKDNKPIGVVSMKEILLEILTR